MGERWFEAVRVGAVVEIEASPQEMLRAIGGKKLKGTGDRAGQSVQHAAYVFLWKVEFLRTDAGCFDFMAEYHLVGIFDQGQELVSIRKLLEGAMQFG